MPDHRPPVMPAMPAPPPTADYVTPPGLAGPDTPADAAGPPADPPPWPDVPGYAVTAEIARGGMGVVYAARDLALGRDVAVKTVLPRLAADPRYAAQFDREARLTAALPHPAIPPVHALGTLPDGRPFLAMKLVRGRTLADDLAATTDRAADRPRLVGVFEQVCHAVGYAHTAGVVHRDLKPSNVMVGAFGEVQVMDWGLAKAGFADAEGVTSDGAGPAVAPGGAGETRAGEAKGSPPYMAPEQARGEWGRVGPRADVFALGGILCDLLTGKPPYAREGFYAVLRQAGNADLADARARLGACGADAELVGLCVRCLAADPADRPADGRAVADAVAGYRAGVEERARRAQAERAAAAAEAREQRKRRRVQLALAAAVGLLLLGGGAFAWWDQKRDTDQAQVEGDKSRAEAEKLRADAEAERHAQVVRERVAAARVAVATRLEQARAALRVSNAELAAGPLADSGERIAEGGADDFRPELAAGRADLAVLRELDQIDDDRWTSAGGYLAPHAGTVARLAKAFAGYGIVPGAIPPVQAAERINGSLIRERLLTSLELWFVLDGRPAGVGEFLAAADPDEFRNEVRAGGYQRTALGRAFRGQPLPPAPAAWFAVAHGEDRSLGREARKQLLLAAYRGRPNNFTLLMALGAADLGSAEAVQNDSARTTAGWYRAALALRPRNAVAWNNLGTALRRTRDLAGARAAYEEVLVLNPKSVLAHTNLGLTLDAGGDRAGALAWHRKAAALGSGDAGTLTLLGMALMEAGDRQGALEVQKQAVAADRAYAPAHALLGHILYTAGDRRGAAVAYREAVRLAPDAPTAPHQLLAAALQQSGNSKAAVLVYREVVRRNPDNPTAHDELGVALRESGDPAGAADAHRAALRLAPKSGRSHLDLGLALRELGNSSGALAEFRAAARLAPDDPDAWTNLGAALRDEEDLRGALAALKTAVKVGPDHAPAHTNLGLVLRATGDTAGAIAAHTRATEIDPTFVLGWTNLGVAFGASGNSRGAVHCARRAIELAPDDAFAHGLLGLALKDLGDIFGARAALARAAQLDPKQWERTAKQLPYPVAPRPRAVGR